MLIQILKIYLQEHLLIKCFTIKDLTLVKIQNMMHGYQRNLASVVNFVYSGKSSVSAIKKGIMPTRQFAKELHKPIVRNI